MKIFLLFVLIVSPTFVISQKEEPPIVFNIIYKENVVGTLKASTYEEGEFTVYVVKTNVTKKILHIKHCVYDLIVKYKNDKLYSSDYTLYINEIIDKTATLKTEGGQLRGVKNGRAQNKPFETIAFSSALFYFKEPKGITGTFSEPKLKPRSLMKHKTKKNTYVLDKNKGEYYYENGQLQKMTVDDLVYVEMIRQ